MSGYVCIAMLEDPPYSIYLAATEEEPEDWCAGLPLSSHLLCYEAFEDPQDVAKQCIRELKAEGVEARTYIAFSAKPWEVMRKFLSVRDEAIQDVRSVLRSRIVEVEESDEGPEQGTAKLEHSEDISGQGWGYYHHAQQLDLDDENRLALMKKAAEAGYTPAIEQVIDAYYNGWGCDESIEESLNWVIDKDIQIDGSQLYNFSQRFDLEDPNRLRLVKMAAEAGYSQAIEDVLDAYAYGWGCDKDLEEAMTWALAKDIQLDGDQLYSFAELFGLEDSNRLKLLKLAAEAGNTQAIQDVIEAYQYGWGCLKGNLKEVYEWIMKNGIKLGNDRLYDLALDCYPEEESESHSQVEFKMLSELAMAGHPKSMLKIAQEYYYGVVVKQDCRQSLLWADKIKHGDLDEYYIRDLGCLYYDIAIIYQEGNDKTISDPKRAIKLFKKAAGLDYSSAYLSLSYAYKDGDGVKKDLNEALYWAMKDKDAGSAYGYAQVASCFIEAGQMDRASEVWKQCFHECDIEKYALVLTGYAIDVVDRRLTPVHTREIAKNFHHAIKELELWDESNLKKHGYRFHSNAIAWLKLNSAQGKDLSSESTIANNGTQKKSTSQLISDAENGDLESEIELIRSYIDQANPRQALLLLNRLQIETLDHEYIFHVATLYQDLSYSYARGLGLSDELPGMAAKLLCKSIDLYSLIAYSESTLKHKACIMLYEIYSSGDILPKEPEIASKWMKLSAI